MKGPRRISNALLLIFSLIFVFLMAEYLLRLTSFGRFRTGKDLLRGYAVNDEVLGYDLTKNHPPMTQSLANLEYPVWSNEMGCFDLPQKEDEPYVLVVGDSFTWGHVPFELRYSSVISQKLGMRVLNCAVPGYGTKQEWLKIQQVLKEIKKPPQRIVVGYFLGNDFIDDLLFPRHTVIDGYFLENVKISDAPDLHREMISDDTLKLQMKNWCRYGVEFEPQGLISKIGFWLTKHSLICDLIQDGLSRYGIFKTQEKTSLGLTEKIFKSIENNPGIKAAWREHLDNLKKIKILSDSMGVRLLVILIPPRGYFDAISRGEKHYSMIAEKKIKEYLSQEKIEYLDLVPLFQESIRQKHAGALDAWDLYWRNESHLNPTGHALTGAAAATMLSRQEPIGVSGANGEGSKQAGLKDFIHE